MRVSTKLPDGAFVDDAEEPEAVILSSYEDGKVATVERDEVPDCPEQAAVVREY